MMHDVWRRAVVVGVVLCFACVAVVSVYGHGGGDHDDDGDDEDVTVLTQSTFDEFVNRHELSLVEFYAPWCGHCKHLKPEYAAAATILKKNDPPIPLAKVDATQEGSLAGKYKVNGYPTLFLFRNGRDSPYNGPRETKGIVDFMRKQAGPAAKPLATEDDLNRFTTWSEERDHVVVGFFPPTQTDSTTSAESKRKSTPLHAAFLVASNEMREDYLFGIVTDPDLTKKQGLEGEAIVFFKNYDEKKTIFKGKKKKKELEDWIVQQSLPLVGEYTESRHPRFQKRGLPVIKFFTKIDYSPANEKHRMFYESRLKEIATEFRDKLLVTLANSTAFASAMRDLGWENKEHTVVLEAAGGRQRYKFEKPFNVKNLKQFVQDYFAGGLLPYIKSEPTPPTNDGPVKIVVGHTFNEIVNDPNKDVLIEFYAPWCGHCKALEPKYIQLGQKMKDVETVTIAKMDATANDVPNLDFEVKGFPTIYFKPAGRSPMKYEGGEREVSDFVAFIKKHATNPVSFQKRKRKA